MVTFYGTTGNDNIEGTSGNDSLYGYPKNYRDADGNDTINGRAGNDRIDGGNNNDRLFGGDGNDFLLGSFGSDSLYGGVGDDALGGDLGGRGDTDALYGGAGNDRLRVTGLNSYASGDDGNDIVSILEGGDGLLIGGNGNDRLNGSDGDNTLDGGNGNDVLNSLDGDDTLTGGSGKDIFWFYSTDYDSTITDFSVADDSIYAYAVDAGSRFNITPEQFRLGSSARDSSDRFIYNPGTGALFYDSDGTGSTKQELFAQLQPDLAVTYRDIFVS